MSELEPHEFRPPESLPDYVPVARAVEAGNAIPNYEFTLPYAPAVRREGMSPLRACLQLLGLLPVSIVGASAAHLVVGQRLVDNRWINVLSTVTMGTAVLIYIVVILRLDGHRAVTIGWTAQRFWKNVIIGLAGFVMMYVYAMLMVWVIVQIFPDFLSQEPTAQKAIEQTFPPMRVLPMLLMMTFVAIWEEAAFRGFMLTRLKAILRYWWLTVPVGAMIFGMIHFYQGLLAVGLITVMGFIMGVLFVLRRSLVPCITFHFANNMIMMLILRWISTDW